MKVSAVASFCRRVLWSFVALATVIALLARPEAAWAVDWTGGGTTSSPGIGNWSVPGNWAPAGVPASDSTAILRFGGSGTGAYTATDDLTGAFLLNQLILNSSSSGAITLAGTGAQSLQFSGSASQLLQNGAGTVLLQSTLPLNLSVPVYFGSTPLTLGSAGTVTVASNLSGSGELVKSGPWQLTLQGNNSAFSGGIRIYRGTVQAEMPAMTGSGTVAQNPLGTGAVTLAGGQLNLRVDGPSNSSNYDFRLGNALIVTAPSTISLDRRTSSGGSEKNLVFSNLTIQNTQLTVSQNNGFRLGISGDINLVGDAVISAGDVTNFTSGRITDYGKAATLNKLGGYTLNILSSNNDYTGGTVVSGSATLRVGSGYGTPSTNDTAVAGTGPIVVDPGSRAAFRRATNFAPGQTVDVVSNVGSYGVLELNDNFLPTPLRTLGTGVLSVGGTTLNKTVDLGRIGDGTWRLASSNTFGDVTLGTGAKVLAGAGNLIRIGGYGVNNGTSQLTATGTDTFSGSASLEVGGPLVNGGQPSGSSVVMLSAANNYTGSTVVNRGNTLRIQQGGAGNASLGATPAVHVFGEFRAEGTNGTFFDANGDPLNVTLYGGSTLHFDNSTLTTSTDVNRWSDTVPISLNTSTLRLTARKNNSVTSETVGNVTFTGGSVIDLQRDYTYASSVAQLNVAGFERVGRGTLELTRATSSSYGSNLKLVVGSAPTVTNGMVAPFVTLIDNTTFTQFANYTAANGYSNAGFTDTVKTADLVSGALPTGLTDGVERVFIDPDASLGYNLDVYAMKLAGSLNSGVGNQITIRSGGLIISGDATNNGAATPVYTYVHNGNVNLTINPNLVFNDGTNNVEAVINVRGGSTATVAGSVTASALTKSGDGTLVVKSGNSGFNASTPVTVNRGVLQLENAAAVGTAPISVAGGQLNLRGTDHATFSNALTLAQGNPLLTINVGRSDTVADNKTFTVSSLTLEGSGTSQGQTLNFTGTNNFDLAVSGVTTVTGNATFHTANSGSDLFLDGGFLSTTADAVITKSGSALLRIAGNNTTAAGTQVTLNGGTLELRSTSTADGAFTPVGSTANTKLVLNSGTLALRTQGGNGTFGGTTATAGGYNVVVKGDATIDVGRYTGTTSDKRLRLGGLTIGSQTLSITSNAGYYLGINGPVVMNGDPVFNAAGSAPQPEFYGQVSGGRLIKQGTSTLRLLAGDNVNTYDGGSIVNQGWLYGFNAQGLGTGDILVNPGGGVAVGKNTTLQAGQKVYLRSSSSGLAMFGMNYGTLALPSTLAPNLDFAQAASGLIGLGGSYTLSLDMNNLFGDSVSGDDSWYLGAIAWADTSYRANSLGAGAGNTYRLGGGGGNMNLNRNNKASASGAVASADLAQSVNLLTGANSVVIGMPSNNLLSHMNASAVLASTNDYSGGTTVHRGMGLHLVSPATPTNSGAGTGTIDVYGELRLRNSGTLANGSGGNVNTVVTHPGSAIRLDSNDSSIGFSTPVNHADRWGDNAEVTLDGARLYLYGRDSATTTESVGSVTFARGSSLFVDRTGTGRAYLTIAGLTRSGSGTLLISQGEGLLPDAGTPDNMERVIVSGTAPAVINGMVAPYIVDAYDHTFLTYNSTVAGTAAIGFQQAAFDKTITSGAYTAGSLQATDKVNISSATLTLTDNPTVYALKTNQNINASGTNNTITIRSGGLIGAGGTVNANLVFNDGSQNIETLIYTGGNTTLAGTVTASQITKFGQAELGITAVNPIFNGPWVINDGILRLNTLNGTGTGSITVNGGGSANGSDGNGPGIVFGASLASPEEAVYTHGDITSWDNNRFIFAPGADRTLRVGNFTLKATGDLSVVQLRTDNSRMRANLGTLTIDSPEAILNVTNSASTSGGSSVVALDALVGNNKTITKLGNGMLELANLNSTFNHSTLIVGQGALRVLNGASLGDDNAVTIDQNAALEIAGSNFATVGTTTLTQKFGSAERWNVEDARGMADFAVAPGVNLQLNTSLTSATPRTITLNGGSLEAFVYTDTPAKAVFRTVGPAVTINLADHSYVGQNLYVGMNGADIGLQPNNADNNPLGAELRGAVLLVEGAIAGSNYDLTKVGRDVVVLAGHNSYRNTIVEQGLLRIGTDNSLPTAGILTTRFQGTFDLYGFNQTVGNLGTKDAAPPVGGTGLDYSGRIVNSAITSNSLTAGNADNYTYNGVIEGNIALVKTGTGRLNLRAANTYRDGTTVNQGVLAVNNASGSATGSGNVVVNSGGTLAGTGFISGSVSVQAGGRFAAGNSIGTLTTGSLALAGITEIELGTPGASGDRTGAGKSDLGAVNGTLTLGGTLALRNNANAGGLGSVGAGSYQIFTSTGGVGGSFAAIDNSGIQGYHGVPVVDGNNVYLDVVTAAQASMANSIDLGTIITGASFASHALSMTNSSTGSYLRLLNASVVETLGAATASGAFSGLRPGETDSTSLLVGLSADSLGVQTGTVTIDLQSELSGMTPTNIAELPSQMVNVTGTVLDHANASFDGSGDVNELTINFGTLQSDVEALTVPFEIFNLPSVAGASATASLDLDSVIEIGTGSPSLTTNLASFSNLAANGGHQFVAQFDPAGLGLGALSRSFQLNLSDQDLPGAIAQTLVLHLQVTMVPEPSTLVLIGISAAFAVFTVRRFRRV